MNVQEKYDEENRKFKDKTNNLSDIFNKELKKLKYEYLEKIKEIEETKVKTGILSDEEKEFRAHVDVLKISLKFVDKFLQEKKGIEYKNAADYMYDLAVNIDNLNTLLNNCDSYGELFNN